MESQGKENKAQLGVLLEKFTNPTKITQALYGEKGGAGDLLERVASAGTLELQSFCDIAEDLCMESSFWRSLYELVFPDLYNLFSDHVEPFVPVEEDEKAPLVIVESQRREPAFWRDIYTDTLAVSENENQHSAFERLINEEPPLMAEVPPGSPRPYPKEFAFESFDEDTPLEGDEYVLAEFPQYYPTLSVIIARSQGVPRHFSRIVVSWGNLGSFLSLTAEDEKRLFPYMSKTGVLAVLVGGGIDNLLSDGLIRAVKNGWIDITKEILTLTNFNFHPKVYSMALDDAYDRNILLMLLRDRRSDLEDAIPVMLDEALERSNEEAIELLLDEVEELEVWCDLNVIGAFNSSVSLEILGRVFRRVNECMEKHEGSYSPDLYTGTALRFPPSEKFEHTERELELAKLFVSVFDTISVRDLTLYITVVAEEETLRFLFSASDKSLFGKGNVDYIFGELDRRGMMGMILWLIKNGGDSFKGVAATSFAVSSLSPLVFAALVEAGVELSYTSELWMHIANGDTEELSEFLADNKDDMDPMDLDRALYHAVTRGLVESARILLLNGANIAFLQIQQNQRIDYEESMIIKAFSVPEMGVLLIKSGLDVSAFPGVALNLIAKKVGIKKPRRKADMIQALMVEYKRQLSLGHEEATPKGKAKVATKGKVGQKRKEKEEERYENMTVRVLQGIARELEIKGRSKMRKAELVAAIKENESHQVNVNPDSKGV